MCVPRHFSSQEHRSATVPSQWKHHKNHSNDIIYTVQGTLGHRAFMFCNTSASQMETSHTWEMKPGITSLAKAKQRGGGQSFPQETTAVTSMISCQQKK